MTDDGAGGILFQRPDDRQTIWWLPANATAPLDELVTLEAGTTLILEGVAGSGDDRQIVYQKVLEFGGPEEVASSLRTYSLADGSLREIVETGGWESSTTISPVVGGTATGVRSSEGWVGAFWYDILAGESLVPASDSDELDFVGEGFPEVIAGDGGALLGVVSVWNEATDVIDQFDLVWLDDTGHVIDTIATFPWDNGYWYVTDLMVVDGHAVISRHNPPRYSQSERTPMGPIVVDLSTGDAITLPFAAEVRPATS